MTSRATGISGGCSPETLEAKFEPVRVWPFFSPARHSDTSAVKPLQTGPQHRTVDFTQQPAGDVDDALGVDAEQIAVEREMVDRAERDPVDDCGDALVLGVGDDVGGLDELALAQGADRAAVAVGAHDVELEALLMQPVARLARGVRPQIDG